MRGRGTNVELIWNLKTVTVNKNLDWTFRVIPELAILAFEKPGTKLLS